MEKLGNKEIKGIGIGEEKVKLSLFSNNACMCRNTENSSQRQLEFTNSIERKDTKVSIFHYITNKIDEEETIKANPSTTATESKIKCPGNKLHLGNERCLQ